MKNIIILLSLIFLLGSCLEDRNDIVPDLPEEFGTNVNRTLIWYFGDFAGIDFNNSPPTALLDSKMATDEGCATLCDASGQLLMYTDGSQIWDKTHQIMPNSFGLGGNTTSTQSGIIIPDPGNKELYYVLSVDWQGRDGGLQYAQVDLSASDGLGEVISKNNVLMDRCSEKVTTVLHADGDKMWIIAHEYGNNNFAIFLLDENGLNNQASTVSIGNSHDGSFNGEGAIGYLKASPDGTKLALAEFGSNFVELFNFNNSTGEISNHIDLSGSISADSYSVEFSPNNKLLYFTGTSENSIIYQANIELETEEEIKNSIINIGMATSERFGALQNGPDGKIYIAKSIDGYLSVINNPNQIGIACNFQEDVIYLEGRNSILGLPNLIPSFFR